MMKTEITADEIVSLLHALGYRAMCELDGDILTVNSASQGFEWEIFVGERNENEAANFLIFTHSRDVNPVQFPVGRICNEFNRTSPHGVATFSMDDREELIEDARITLDFSISLIGGVADEWLEDSISMWEMILGMFDQKVRECEEPAAKDESF